MKSTLKVRLLLTAMFLALSHASLSSAQTTNTSPGANTQGSTAAPTKAERKAARQQARAKKNAELKKLEDAGYSPATRDEGTYPQDIQNAEKKAGIGQKPAQ
ncbi:hypothetical protein [Caballeronia novacaledonica]|uniref:DUF4148 domain-containing protein n=1 Tax=Caballeronia novacaledonica TaxID=1544861 RepID=A0AA37IBR1_9BURK|nr:hypothetical protein [Caballeronia novacaledonica]GJH27021.1 DUF4148 domain-containing protein [Caballeronia novacaledonica]